MAILRAILVVIPVGGLRAISKDHSWGDPKGAPESDPDGDPEDDPKCDPEGNPEGNPEDDPESNLEGDRESNLTGSLFLFSFFSSFLPGNLS